MSRAFHKRGHHPAHLAYPAPAAKETTVAVLVIVGITLASVALLFALLPR